MSRPACVDGLVYIYIYIYKHTHIDILSPTCICIIASKYVLPVTEELTESQELMITGDNYR